MTSPDLQILRQLANRLMREHGVRPAYYPHVRSILRWCKDDLEMRDTLAILYKNGREWFW
jgi:hypothetical protein